jgi:hypothetical protein
MLAKCYPDVKWDLTRFPVVPYGYWEDEQHTKAFIEVLKQKMGIRSAKDWSFVTKAYGVLQS